MLVFSNFSALLPTLQAEWGLSNTEAGLIVALQSSVGFAMGALGPAVFGAVLDWAPRFGASPDSTWAWGFGALGIVALAGPLAVGFKEQRRAPETLVQESHGQAIARRRGLRRPVG